MNRKKDYAFLIKECVNKMELIISTAEDAGRELNETEQASYETLSADVARYEAMANRQTALEKIRGRVNEPTTDEPPHKDPPAQGINDAKWYKNVFEAASGNFANAAAAGLTELTGSEGGYIVPPAMTEKLLDVIYKSSVLIPYCKVVHLTSSNRYKVIEIKNDSRVTGSRNGGSRAYWIGSSDEVTASTFKIEEIEIKLGKLMSLCYADSELIEDAGNLQQAIEDIFKDEFAFSVDDAIIRGTGKGYPLGILKAGGLVTVAKETGQLAKKIVFENIQKMWRAMDSRAKKNAIWLINSEVGMELQSMTMPVGTGGVPVFMPAYGVSGNPYNSIYGRPVLEVEQCSALGEVGDIILADLSDYRWIDKGSIKMDSSITVKYEFDEEAFRFRYRANGTPRTLYTQTPYKGTVSKGKYVTLAARE